MVEPKAGELGCPPPQLDMALTESSYCRHSVAWTKVARPEAMLLFSPLLFTGGRSESSHARCRSGLKTPAIRSPLRKKLPTGDSIGVLKTIAVFRGKLA